MYMPRPFREDDRARLVALATAHPFATVVCVRPPEASQAERGEDLSAAEIAHLPCLVDDALATVQLHVARGNPLGALAAQGARLTAVFRGPHAYVSPRWYTEPTRQVPTWSYAVVHVAGPARVLAEDELLVQLRAMAARFEEGAPDQRALAAGPASRPWSVDDAAPGIIQGLLGGVVGIAIDVDRIEGKFKLGQNRAAEDRAGVVRALEARGAPGDADLAALMRATGR
jgi:transcriptional regulator